MLNQFTLLEVFVSLCLDQIICLSHNILTVVLVSLQGLEFSVALVCTKYPMHYHHNSKVSIFDTKSARTYRAYTES